MAGRRLLAAALAVAALGVGAACGAAAAPGVSVQPASLPAGTVAVPRSDPELTQVPAAPAAPVPAQPGAAAARPGAAATPPPGGAEQLPAAPVQAPFAPACPNSAARPAKLQPCLGD